MWPPQSPRKRCQEYDYGPEPRQGDHFVRHFSIKQGAKQRLRSPRCATSCSDCATHRTDTVSHCTVPPAARIHLSRSSQSVDVLDSWAPPSRTSANAAYRVRYEVSYCSKTAWAGHVFECGSIARHHILSAYVCNEDRAMLAGIIFLKGENCAGFPCAQRRSHLLTCRPCAAEVETCVNAVQQRAVL